MLIALSLAVAAYGLMQTMLVPTIGALQGQMHIGPAAASWAVLSAPLLASAVLTPLIGRAGDAFGKRRLLLGTLLIYLGGILGAMLAPDAGALIAFRAVQGISMAVLPLSFGIAREALPGHRVTFGLAWLAGLTGGTAGLGLVCGGLVVDHASWRWLFVIGAAITVLALILVYFTVPESRHVSARSLDVRGGAVLAACLVALLLALTEGPKWGWSAAGVLGLFAAAAVLAVVLVGVERRHADPLLDIRQLSGGPIMSIHITAFLLGVNQFALYVVVPRLAEYGLGTSVTGAGLIMLPGAVLGLLASASVARLERMALPLGMALSGVGAGLLALWHANAGAVVPFYGLASVGWGFAVGALPKLVSNVVAITDIGAVTAVNTVARTVGGALGSQLAVAFSGTRALWIAAGFGAAAIGLAANTGGRDSLQQQSLERQEEAEYRQDRQRGHREQLAPGGLAGGIDE
jgi:predicted MFS family arabinose efflux permease